MLQARGNELPGSRFPDHRCSRAVDSGPQQDSASHQRQSPTRSPKAKKTKDGFERSDQAPGASENHFRALVSLSAVDQIDTANLRRFLSVRTWQMRTASRAVIAWLGIDVAAASLADEPQLIMALRRP